MTTLPFVVDGPSWDMSKVVAHIELVKLGVRPVAEVVVRNEHLAAALAEVMRLGVRSVTFPRGQNHTALFIHIHPHLGQVIRRITDGDGEQSVLDTWIFGKMFGYSEQAIAEMVSRTA